jgi:hypothetical protein
MTGRQVDNIDPYSAKLSKLIPGEVSAAYLAINSLVSLDQGYNAIIIGSLIVLTILCPLYLWKLRNVRNRLQIAFTTASFPLWALNISNGRSEEINQTVMGVVLILVTLVIPLIQSDNA